MKVPYYVNWVLAAGVLMSSCSSRYVSTSWRNDHAYPGNYSKIMVAVILNSNDSSYRKEIEIQLQQALESLGYPATSAYLEFGAAGLRELGQENTYVRLCSKGIDAVMTIAPVDKSTHTETPVKAFAQPVTYYYDHMWQYRDQQSYIPELTRDSVFKYSWEMILFDLSTLQPHYIAATKPVVGNTRQSVRDGFWKALLQKLRKDKFLKSRPPVIYGPKAF